LFLNTSQLTLLTVKDLVVLTREICVTLIKTTTLFVYVSFCVYWLLCNIQPTSGSVSSGDVCTSQKKGWWLACNCGSWCKSQFVI